MLAGAETEIDLDGVAAPVRLAPVDEPTLIERVSGGYRAKYGVSWPGPVQTVTGPEAAGTTMRLVDAGEVSQLPARGEAELAEDVAQVGVHRARAEEQLGGHLRGAGAVGDQPGDVQLLQRELVRRLRGAASGVLARGAQLTRRAVGERLCAETGQQLVGRAQPLAGLAAPSLAAQ